MDAPTPPDVSRGVETEVVRVDRAIAAVAARQHGVVSRTQLTAAGLGRGAIAHRVGAGRLHRVHRGVYLVGHPVFPALGREMAAALACGPLALVSHRSSAALWRLISPSSDPVDVTVTGDRKCRPGISVHSRADLTRADSVSVHGIPTTTPLLTLVDLAAVAPPRTLERALEEAQRRRLVTRHDLIRATARAAHRRGAVLLRQIIEAPRGQTLTRSEAEERLLDLVRRAELPQPRLNAHLGGYEVDALWPAHRLVVEVDGYAFHSSRAAFERDRRRDADLQARGYRVFRVTFRQIAEEREALVARLASALAAT